MNRVMAPALNRSLAARSAVARDGQPLSYSRAPAADLAPWIARLYVSIVAAPDSHVLSCGLFCEDPVLRIQLAGDWIATGADGPIHSGRGGFLFGPNSRRMPVAVRGSFTSAGMTFCPGAVRTLGGMTERDMLDRLTDPAQIGMPTEAWMALFDPEAGPEEWCRRMEDTLRARIEQCGVLAPDPVSARFERASYTDPSVSVAQCADAFGIEIKRLERIVRRDFGIPPKQVLRRARALDMASHLRGVADQAEAEDLMLRYYDQSHLIRDFTALIGMSPRQFVARPQPLMTLCLETRQARRLEMLERLSPGQPPPWFDRVLTLRPS
jgi:AraC-like DNA-binding protein